MNELTLIMNMKLGLIPLEGRGAECTAVTMKARQMKTVTLAHSSIYYLLTKNSFSHMHRLEDRMRSIISIWGQYGNPSFISGWPYRGVNSWNQAFRRPTAPDSRTGGVWQGVRVVDGRENFLWPEPQWHQNTDRVMSMEGQCGIMRKDIGGTKKIRLAAELQSRCEGLPL